MDNTGALASLIAGASSVWDVSAVVAVYQALVAKLNCRVWLEHVESATNVSDGVSRDGVDDSFAEMHHCRVVEATLPEYDCLWSAPVEVVVDSLIGNRGNVPRGR